jgi:hypothetical protein
MCFCNESRWGHLSERWRGTRWLWRRNFRCAKATMAHRSARFFPIHLLAIMFGHGHEIYTHIAALYSKNNEKVCNIF